jgi:hypothetical protein
MFIEFSPVSSVSRSYIISPSWHQHGGSGTALVLPLSRSVLLPPALEILPFRSYVIMATAPEVVLLMM